ncbi:ABC transporter ATP-binding protein [Sesbania bispinosa]|nr:ABC transporter ATP-binding protein [Sesbania bispinosa]
MAGLPECGSFVENSAQQWRTALGSSSSNQLGFFDVRKMGTSWVLRRQTIGVLRGNQLGSSSSNDWGSSTCAKGNKSEGEIGVLSCAKGNQSESEIGVLHRAPSPNESERKIKKDWEGIWARLWNWENGGSD